MPKNTPQDLLPRTPLPGSLFGGTPLSRKNPPRPPPRDPLPRGSFLGDTPDLGGRPRGPPPRTPLPQKRPPPGTPSFWGGPRTPKKGSKKGVKKGGILGVFFGGSKKTRFTLVPKIMRTPAKRPFKFIKTQFNQSLIRRQPQKGPPKNTPQNRPPKPLPGTSSTPSPETPSRDRPGRHPKICRNMIRPRPTFQDFLKNPAMMTKRLKCLREVIFI